MMTLPRVNDIRQHFKDALTNGVYTTDKSGVKTLELCGASFFADEEAGMTYGSRWMAAKHPEVFAGCSEAISEVGGFSVTVGDDLSLIHI